MASKDGGVRALLDKYKDLYKPKNKASKIPHATEHGNFDTFIEETFTTEVKHKLPKDVVANNELSTEILTKAGPNTVYFQEGYDLNELADFHRIASAVGDHANFKGYRINDDSEPIRIVKTMDDIEHEQNIKIRYLEPPQPPTPAPIIITEKQLPAPSPPPPILIRQYGRAPRTPTPLVVREMPPTPPPKVETTYIEKILPAPPTPPRQVIIERIPAPPQKPRTIIYEKWLPYKPQAERPVIIEKASRLETPKPVKNIIIDYETPKQIIKKTYVDEGIVRADPELYKRPATVTGIRYVEKIKELPEDYLSKYATIIGTTARLRTPSAPPRPPTAPREATPKPATPKPPTPKPPTPKPETSAVPEPKLLQRAKTSFGKGPNLYYSPWNTTYRTSYTMRSFERLY